LARWNNKKTLNRTYGILSVYSEVHTAYKALAKANKISVREYTEMLILKELKAYNGIRAKEIKKILSDIENIENFEKRN